MTKCEELKKVFKRILTLMDLSDKGALGAHQEFEFYNLREEGRKLVNEEEDGESKWKQSKLEL